MILELVVVIAAYLAWGVGANTIGTVLGITLGSGVLKLRNAVIISSVFTGLGAIFLSKRIMVTMGEKIAHLDMLGILIVFVTAGTIITFTTYRRIPIFVTYLFIGAIAGYSLVKGLGFDLLMFRDIMVSLFVSPLAAMMGGYVIYQMIKQFKLKKIKSAAGREDYEKKFAIPAIIGLILLSFAVGGNSVGVAVGVLERNLAFSWLVLLGTGGAILGILTWSYRVATTVGMKMTDLSPSRGFAVQVATGLVLFIFLWLSIPVSTTQTLIGAIIGVAFARGKIEPGTVKNIAFSWIFGLPAAVGIAALIAYLI
ncbi:MAG: inorganic phosphate transporter [archaeon]